MVLQTPHLATHILDRSMTGVNTINASGASTAIAFTQRAAF